MKKLLVLRHAKSSWVNPELADFERPLNERGVLTAPFMGSLMTAEGLVPELIVSSPAERAKHTAELVTTGGSMETAIRLDDRIYEASPLSLLQVARDIDPEFASIMIVGHNPGIEGFIRLLTGQQEAMPTAALAEIDVDISEWDEIAAGSGKLIRVIRPKDRMKTLGSSG